MSTTQQFSADEDADRDMRGTVRDFVKKQVVLSLGTPGDLLAVQVHPVGGA